MITLHEGEMEGITMKHYSLSLLLLCFLSAVLLGCQSANSEPLPAGELSKISISKSNGFGKVDGDFLAEYEDQETLDLFKHAIAHASKRAGIADMAEPEFDVKSLLQMAKAELSSMGRRKRTTKYLDECEGYKYYVRDFRRIN